jgi:polygalacturonase
MNRTRRFVACRTIVFSVAVAIAASGSRLYAQDTRTVKEPVVPAACVTLKAEMTAAFATSGDIEARADRTGSGKSGLDTARLQQALDHCDKGNAVELALDAANTAFLTGPIYLRPGVTLLLDKGVTLYGTRNPEYYAVSPGSCGLVNDQTNSGCKPLITVKSASGSGIMGDGAIDGQGGASMMVDGKTATKTWWNLADDAHITGRQQAPRMIDTDLSDNFTLYRITLKNSANVHVAFHRGDGLTVWGVKIDTPKTARNTDGIDPEQSKNITVTQSYIRTGDDNIAIKAGDGPTTNITIAHNHFYSGHGLSIGGETNGGVSGIRVEDLSLDGPDNGIRIRSSPARGGPVEHVAYEDVCIRNSKSPILFDTVYTFPGKGVQSFPDYKDITLRDVRITGGGKIQFNGFDQTHRIGVTLDGVMALDAVARYRAQTIHTDLTFGPGPVNLVFTGDDSTVTGKEVSGKLPACAARFVPFP